MKRKTSVRKSKGSKAAAKKASARKPAGKTPAPHGVAPGIGLTQAARLGLLVLLLGAAAGCAALGRAGENWRDLRRDSSGQAPDAAETREAVLQIYTARSVGWRGVLAVHSRIPLEPSG